MENLEVIYYPHPTLRHPSKPLVRVDAELKQMVQQMFELMYEHKGIGLAANQVDLPFQLFVINLESDPDQKDQEFVFINPVLSKPKGGASSEEGCLSIPKVYGNVARPESVHVKAYNLQGQVFDQRVDGLFARVIQHETDHLNGVLFPDRMSDTEAKMIQGELQEFKIDFESRQNLGSIPDPETIRKRLNDLEARYCQAKSK